MDKLPVSRLPTIRESESYSSFVLEEDWEPPAASSSSSREAQFVYQVRGQVANPLKLSLCRSQYEQLLDSIKNLSVEAEEEQPPQPEEEQQRLPSRKTSVESTSGSTSASPYEGSFEVRTS